MFLRSIIKYGYKRSTFQKPAKGSLEEKNLNRLQMINIEMSQKLKHQKQNIEKNTPRIAVGITALFAIPSFYYLYRAIDLNYSEPEYYRAIKCSIDWINIKFAFLSGVMFSLETLRFKDFKVQVPIIDPRATFIVGVIPTLAALFSLSTHESHSKWWAGASFINLFGQIMLYSVAVNKSLVPFWVFNLLYHVKNFITIFVIKVYAIDFFVLFLSYYLLRNLGREITTRPHKFNLE